MQVDNLMALVDDVGPGGKLALERVPRVDTAEQRAAYDALAHRIYEGLPGPPEERARTPKGQLAAALWQRVAEWDEGRDGD